MRALQKKTIWFGQKEPKVLESEEQVAIQKTDFVQFLKNIS